MIQESAEAGPEDDLVVDNDEFFVEEHLDGVAEDVAFELLALRADFLSGVAADVDVEDILENDGAFVEVFGDEVGGAAGDADALLPRLMVRLRTGEVRQQGRVDVDDLAGVLANHLRRDDLHVTR